MVTSCPVYDGSVRTSWYPVIEVLNTTSPNAVPAAPYTSPWKVRPSSSISTAGSPTPVSSRNVVQVLGRRGFAAATIYRRGSGCQPAAADARLAGGGAGGQIPARRGGVRKYESTGVRSARRRRRFVLPYFSYFRTSVTSDLPLVF